MHVFIALFKFLIKYLSSMLSFSQEQILFDFCEKKHLEAQIEIINRSSLLVSYKVNFLRNSSESTGPSFIWSNLIEATSNPTKPKK